mmetsp:Transcript_17676/g.26770  ORF Transcript_17676/g.26770 Transcript_17676/m.26770 type:complete len:84 (-) Transcript_17676:116-367(-)
MEWNGRGGNLSTRRYSMRLPSGKKSSIMQVNDNVCYLLMVWLARSRRDDHFGSTIVFWVCRMNGNGNVWLKAKRLGSKRRSNI